MICKSDLVALELKWKLEYYFALMESKKKKSSFITFVIVSLLIFVSCLSVYILKDATFALFAAMIAFALIPQRKTLFLDLV